VSHPVRMSSIRTGDTLREITRFAACSVCGAEIMSVVPEDDREDDLTHLTRQLTANGCEHWRAPFEDEGAPFDPRTEFCRTLDEPGLTGEVHGFVPVQGSGLVDGLPWYYRNRDDDDETFAIGATPSTDATRVDPDLLHTEPGWLWPGNQDATVPNAVAFIRTCVAAWRAADGPKAAWALVRPPVSAATALHAVDPSDDGDVEDAAVLPDPLRVALTRIAMADRDEDCDCCENTRLLAEDALRAKAP